jgi:hypothetical protein
MGNGGGEQGGEKKRSNQVKKQRGKEATKK